MSKRRNQIDNGEKKKLKLNEKDNPEEIELSEIDDDKQICSSSTPTASKSNSKE